MCQSKMEKNSTATVAAAAAGRPLVALPVLTETRGALDDSCNRLSTFVKVSPCLTFLVLQIILNLPHSYSFPFKFPIILTHGTVVPPQQCLATVILQHFTMRSPGTGCAHRRAWNYRRACTEHRASRSTDLLSPKRTCRRAARSIDLLPSRESFVSPLGSPFVSPLDIVGGGSGGRTAGAASDAAGECIAARLGKYANHDCREKKERRQS